MGVKVHILFYLLCASYLQLVPARGRRLRDLIDFNGIPTVTEDFSHEAMLPKFAEPIPNVTVIVGKDALLPCVVENLRGYKVAWVRVDTQTILTIHHNVITRNQRITLAHNDHRSWYLQVKGVHETDRGWYMCQINTDPMRSVMGYLEVVVPPNILDKETSSDMVVKEGSNVTMTCKAIGHPEPYVMWRREDNQEISYNGINVNVIDGDVLHIVKVSRLHMGAYLCIASNGIPPSISKRIYLKVQFPPMLWIPNQLEGAYLGQNVMLECNTEAYPKSINYWTTDKGEMITSGDKFESVLMDSTYKVFMRLKIRNVTRLDFGSFKCIARNSLGETDGNIRLYDIPAPPTTTSPMMTTVSSISEKNKSKLKVRPKSKGLKQTKHRDAFQNELHGDYDVEEWRERLEYDAGDLSYGSNSVPSVGPVLETSSSGGALKRTCQILFTAFVLLAIS